MLFWHLGGTLLLFRYVFRDPKVDVRWLMLGAVLPNLVDKPLGTLLAPAFFGADRLVGHSLLFSTVIMTTALLVTRRGRRRRAWMAVAIGAMLHLVLDGMWTSAETFLWPFLGWGFTPGVGGYWDGFVANQLLVPSTIVQEILGLAYLLYMWRKAGLSEPALRQRLVRTGRLAA